MTSKFTTFNFLQLANINLDGAYTANLKLEPARQQVRAEEVLIAFSNALREGKRRAVDAIFIVGNLWDNQTVRQNTIVEVLELFTELNPLPIFISPGQRDILSPDSPYNPNFIKALGLNSWPENVFVFAEKCSVVHHPSLSAIAICGNSFLADRQDRPLQWENVLKSLSHGEHKILLVSEPVDKMFATDEIMAGYSGVIFSEQQMRQLGFDYIAFGFGRNQATLFDENGRLIGAQPGSLAGNVLTEAGPRVALFGQLKLSTDGKIECSIESQEFDNRRICNYSADITGLSSDDAFLEIMQSLKDLGARKDEDMIHLDLEGRYQTGEEPMTIIDKLKKNFFQVVVADNTRPNYLSETFAPGSSEDKFVKAMLVLKKEAEKRMVVETDRSDTSTANFTHLSGRIVEDALYYGLEALRQQKVNLRHVD